MTRHHTDNDTVGRVRIPADVEREDRVLAGLTARQLAILAAVAMPIWLGYLATRSLLPLPVYAGLAAPAAALAAVLALGRRDGVAADRLAMAALRQARAPRRLVPAPEGVTPTPPWVTSGSGAAPLTLPVRQITDDGVCDLGTDGAALVCRVSTVNLGLRTAAEQAALVAAFGRYLNGMPGPVQILLRAQPVDLRDRIAELRAAAGGLPHPALETAALEHAEFLSQLAGSRSLLHRDVLLVLRDPTVGTDVGAGLRRRAEDTRTALAAAGVQVQPLDGQQTAEVLRRAADPAATERPAGLAPPDATITGERR